jgi:hypothetical protein
VDRTFDGTANRVRHCEGARGSGAGEFCRRRRSGEVASDDFAATPTAAKPV